jgi:methyl-accepting chemotaxis protein
MQGLQTVSQSIGELGTMTHQNVAVAEGASSAAAELREQVQRLSEVLSAFNLGQGGPAALPAAGALAKNAAVRTPVPAPAPAAARANVVASPARASTAAAPSEASNIEFF